MTKLFLSLTKLLSLLITGEIKFKDLESALFFFGCSKQWFFETGGERYPIASEYEDASPLNPALARKQHSKIKKLITKAEKEGRVKWGPGMRKRSDEQINDLLIRNGLKPARNLPKIADDNSSVAIAIEDANNKLIREVEVYR